MPTARPPYPSTYTYTATSAAHRPKTDHAGLPGRTDLAAALQLSAAVLCPWKPPQSMQARAHALYPHCLLTMEAIAALCPCPPPPQSMQARAHALCPHCLQTMEAIAAGRADLASTLTSLGFLPGGYVDWLRHEVAGGAGVGEVQGVC